MQSSNNSFAEQETYVVILYEKIQKNDSFYNGTVKTLECFLFKNKPTEDDIKHLKGWYVHMMYPSIQEENIVCTVRSARPGEFKCPAEAIMSKCIDKEYM